MRRIGTLPRVDEFRPSARAPDLRLTLVLGTFTPFHSRRDARAQRLFGPAGTPNIAIIGAGLGGIGLAVRLLKIGVQTFTIFEENPCAGGTWWANRYPGAEVDTPSHIYSLSFKQFDWSRNF